MKKMISAVSVVLGLGAVGEGAWAASYANLALSGTATQSSTFTSTEGTRFEASLAIDGNTDGNAFLGSVSSTHVPERGDFAPWWQVDLGGTHVLSRIVLWNRTDCCSDRLSNFRVSVLNDSQVEVFVQDNFTDGVGFFCDSLPIDLPNNTKARYVRVTLGTNSADLSILSLAEVEVLAVGANKNGDVNGSGVIDLSDAVYLLNSLFLGGPGPVPFAEPPPPAKRFRVNCDGTVTDANTGLTWQKETARVDYHWQEAYDYCKNLQLGGHDDWRLPEVEELFSIVDLRNSPTIDPVFGALSSYYWSVTSIADAPALVWVVGFQSGAVSPGVKGDEGSAYVRAVRTGP